MGMFDNLRVAESLLKKAIEGTDLVLEPYDGYCNFQTKDLDNCLTNFCVLSDNSFVWEKQEYRYEEPSSSSEKKWNFGTSDPVGPLELVQDLRSAYISFYDFYDNDQERIFVTFKAHVDKGYLVDPIVIEKVERTDLKKEAEQFKRTRELWNKIERTWEWRLAHFIINARWRIVKLVRPFTRKLDALENALRERAKARHNYYESNPR